MSNGLTIYMNGYFTEKIEENLQRIYVVRNKQKIYHTAFKAIN